MITEEYYEDNGWIYSLYPYNGMQFIEAKSPEKKHYIMTLKNGKIRGITNIGANSISNTGVEELPKCVLVFMIKSLCKIYKE